MATLKDVAERTGLSISTISYVLNGKKKVRPETYEKILKATEDLDYRPNQLARSLKTHRSMTIGIIVPDITNEFFPAIIQGVDDESHRSGYNIILCTTNNDSAREEECISTLLEKDVDGLIFIGTAQSRAILDKRIQKPVVLVDRKIGNEYPSVITDNYHGGYMATEHLVKCGKNRIALLCGPTFLHTAFERVRGYIDALRDNDLPYADSYIINCDFTIEGGYQATEGLITSGIAFDGIFAANDLIAIGAMRCLLKKGLRIPEDIAIIGYDDITMASVVIPSLTTIHQPKYEIGQQAAGHLVKMINEQQDELKHIVLQPSLIIRSSTPGTST